MTDADLLAILCREPFSGITPEVYASLSDWQILHCICAARDEDNHQLIPIKRRIEDVPLLQRLRGRVEKPLPPIETLSIPAEAKAMMPPLMGIDFIGMYWQRLLRKGFTQEQIFDRWKAYAAKDFN